MSRAFAVALFLIAGSTSHAQAPTTWKEFTSKPGGFTVMFPGEPKEQAIPIGKKSTQTMFFVEKDGAALAVSYQVETVKIDDKNAEPLLTGIRDKLAGIKHKILDEREIKLGETRGVEFLIKTPQGQYLRHRAYFADTRFVQAIYGPKADLADVFDDDAKKFLGSLKLTK